MDRVFFEQLKLPEPQYHLDVGSGNHGKQTGKMLTGVEKILQKELPDIVLVEGDTNTLLAGALAAVKLGIKVGHVEAGLRSYDRSMPDRILEVERTMRNRRNWVNPFGDGKTGSRIIKILCDEFA
jgi:UDP-N-acetylglucosamine 2-epimerase (non-hydrolysing)